MHTLDIFFCIAAVIFIVIGVRRGLIGELFRLLALIIGFIVAFLYYPDLARHLKISSPTIATPLCFSIIYLATAITVIGAGWVLRKLIHLTPLGWLDYLFGGVIGLSKVVIIFWVVCLSFSTFPLTIKRMNLKKSMVYATYTRLPGYLKFDGLVQLRDSFRKNVDRDVPRSLQHAQQNVQKLKAKVDSAKAAETRKQVR